MSADDKIRAAAEAIVDELLTSLGMSVQNPEPVSEGNTTGGVATVTAGEYSKDGVYWTVECFTPSSVLTCDEAEGSALIGEQIDLIKYVLFDAAGDAMLNSMLNDDPNGRAKITAEDGSTITVNVTIKEATR